jgi:hypothetical protein
MVNTTQQVGGSLGVALLNTVFTTTILSYGTNHRTSPFSPAAQVHGYNVAFTVSAVLLGLSTLVTFLLIRNEPGQTVEGEGAGTEAPAAVVHVG